MIQGPQSLRLIRGIVEHVEAKEIRVRRIETIDGKEVKGDLTTFRLDNFIRSNQGTCYNQRPIVSVGDRVEPNYILADGPSMERGELALGRNVSDCVYDVGRIQL